MQHLFDGYVRWFILPPVQSRTEPGMNIESEVEQGSPLGEACAGPPLGVNTNISPSDESVPEAARKAVRVRLHQLAQLAQPLLAAHASLPDPLI